MNEIPTPPSDPSANEPEQPSGQNGGSPSPEPSTPTPPPVTPSVTPGSSAPPVWTRPLQQPPPGSRPVKKPRKRRSAKFTVLVVLFVLMVVFGICLLGVIGIMAARGTPASAYLSGKNVAVVELWGPILEAKDWIDQLETYSEMSGVPAIVLHINSPGGLVTPSQELLNEIKKLQKKYNKIVVAYFDDVAASGAYYAACGADHIVCSPGSMTGSIGVYMKYLEASDLLEKIGVSYQTVKAGKFKDWGGLDRPLAEHERVMLQSVIDDTYNQFVEAVFEGRKESLARVLDRSAEEVQLEAYGADGEIQYPYTEKILDLIAKNNERDLANAEKIQPATATIASVTGTADETIQSETAALSIPKLNTTIVANGDLILELARELSEGKIYTGRQALEIGLVDSLGYLDDAVERAAKMAGIHGEPVVIKREKKISSIFDLIGESLARFVPTGRSESPIQYRSPLIP